MCVSKRPWALCAWGFWIWNLSQGLANFTELWIGRRFPKMWADLLVNFSINFFLYGGSVYFSVSQYVQMCICVEVAPWWRRATIDQYSPWLIMIDHDWSRLHVLGLGKHTGMSQCREKSYNNIELWIIKWNLPINVGRSVHRRSWLVDTGEWYHISMCDLGLGMLEHWWAKFS